MLVAVHRVVWDPETFRNVERLEALNPAAIERVREGELEGTVEVLAGEEWMTCRGTVEEFLKAANGIFLMAEGGAAEVEPEPVDPPQAHWCTSGCEICGKEEGNLEC